MNTEELLRPRYKVIALYPFCIFQIGDIFYKYGYPSSETGLYCYVTNLKAPLQGSSLSKESIENYPHLFKKLEWWEDRKPEEMPEYVKHINGSVHKVIEHEDTGVRLEGSYWAVYKNLQPATLAEYEQYINQKEKQ